jgi:SAM-dependent methyltransferase
MQTDYVTFKERADRSNYIAQRFGNYLTPSLLDVGCDKALLKSLLTPERYLGIDMGGTPDMELNLEQIERLPFDDREFSACVCSDVLEHLDNLHYMFSELVRVTDQHLLISLPNNWANARRPIERGKGGIAHYGLQTEKPVDRHKWFFGFTDARIFLETMADKYSLELVEMVANDKPRNSLVRAIRKLRYSGERYDNRYSHTVWALFKRT